MLALIRNLPDEVRVAWNEALGEADQLATLLGCQCYVFARFGDIGVQVEINGFELGGGHTDDLWVGVEGRGGQVSHVCGV